MKNTMAQRQEARSGFTLVELLVVITIIGILMGLLIPAVNAARETARRNQCATQLNNLAKATIQYGMSHKGMPGWANDFGYYTLPASGVAVDPSDPENTMASAVPHKKIGSWVVSLFPSLDAQPTYEIWTQDKYPLFTSEGSTTEFTDNAAPNLAILQCPSSPNLVGTLGRNSYIANTGMYHASGAMTSSAGIWTGTAVIRSDNDSISGGTPTTTMYFKDAMSKENGVFNNQYDFNNQRASTSSDIARPKGPTFTIDDMKDGQGNTVLFSENLQAIQWHKTFPESDASTNSIAALTANLVAVSGRIQSDYSGLSQFPQGFHWHYRDARGKTFNGSSSATDVMHINGQLADRDIFIEQMDSSNCHQYARPSSAHADGVNMSFGDGGSRFISQQIDYRVYQGLMTPRGKSSDVPFRQYVDTGESL